MMRARGFTLIELIMGIVVVSVAVVGVLLAMRTTVAKSADPMIAHQGIAIAEAYMEEILTKNFSGCSGATRPTYDSVDCYSITPEAPTNQGGNLIPALSAYTVSINIGGVNSCGLGIGADEKLVTIQVIHPSGFAYRLDGCIADY